MCTYTCANTYTYKAISTQTYHLYTEVCIFEDISLYDAHKSTYICGTLKFWMDHLWKSQLTWNQQRKSITPAWREIIWDHDTPSEQLHSPRVIIIRWRDLGSGLYNGKCNKNSEGQELASYIWKIQTKILRAKQQGAMTKAAMDAWPEYPKT